MTTPTASSTRPGARAWLGRLGLPAVLAAVVVLTRLPFLEPGLGLHSDAGALAVAAREIHRTGQYHPSRFPGNPVHEYALSYLIGYGPGVVNGATALCSAVAALFLGLILRTLGCRQWFLGALAFALAPAVYTSSTVIYDYVWALALVLAGLYAGVRRQDLLAGALIGLAIGCRLTSAVMMAGLWMLVLARGSGWRGLLRRWLASGAAMGAVAAACYWPLLSRYGLGFLRAYQDAVHTPFVQELNWLTVGLLGPLGLAAVLAGIVAQIAWTYRPGRSSRDWAPDAPACPARSRWITAAWLVPAGVYLAAFLAMPHRLEYLLPIVPLLILLLAQQLRGRIFAAVCLGLALSPFVAYPAWEAPVRWDHLKRQQQADFLQAVLAKTARSEGKTLVLAGRSDVLLLHTAQEFLWPNPDCEYRPHVAWQDGSPVVLEMDFHPRHAGADSLVRIAYVPDRAAVETLVKAGFALAYLPTARDWYIKKAGFDVRELGGTPFVE